MESIEVNREALIERFPGKGGWSYILIPEISRDHRNHFGQVKISGAIDNYVLDNVILMPMGNGTLFLPLNANIRKQLQKQAGDIVHLKIYLNRSNRITEVDFIDILADEPAALQFYRTLSAAEKLSYLDRINDTKNEEAQIARIADLVNTLHERSRYENSH